MTKELEKNKQINGVLNNNLIQHEEGKGNHTINLRNRAVKDISFLSKLMMDQDFAKIKVLNMSGNNLDDSGAEQIRDLLEDKNQILKLDLSKNKLTQAGLQVICSVLASGHSQLEELDISGNNIPDRNLKMLMGMLYENESIKDIKYTLYE